MNKLLFAALCGCFVVGCAKAPEVPKAAEPAIPAPTSGIDVQNVDDSVRPQDDFFKHVNGKWLASTEIPADKASYGSFDKVFDDSEAQLRSIVDGLRKSTASKDADEQRIADLYASFMDEPVLEGLGLRPLDTEFAKIDALKDKKQIAGMIAHFNRIGVTAPYTPSVHQDAKDSSKYVFDLGQDGLGMPDRDYYLQHNEKMEQARKQYGLYIEKMLTLAGDKVAVKDSKDIVALETELAKVQWTKVENRDPVKTYNKVELAKLAALAPGYDWQAYLADSGVKGKTDYLVVGQPSYIGGFNKLLQKTPLPVWKAYFRWQLLNDFAPFLSKSFVDARFAFYGTALNDIPQNRPRWKRAIALVESSVGESLGKLYVAQYFPPEAKARMDQLVQNLLAAYKADIDTLDWMSPQTKQKAKEKLAKFTTKIGYPSKWRDYSALDIAKDDLTGNVIRARSFEYNRNLNKLGKPIDRDEWGMTPQTVNAYYNPEMNEIVFPAAILQPPFFNPKADDAVNYGGIGGVIGHEISHGFDDQGSQYDGYGTLLSAPGWFAKEDLDKFKAKTHALVEQYAAYEPVPGYHVNGELTLGENIADNSGLAIAYKAYKLSLGNKEAPMIDGLSGDQRFYAGWAQVWRGKTRTNSLIVRIKIDPHAPDAIRGTVPEMNQAPFYDAFGVKEGDKMYLPPEKRVSLW
ncbi:MAG: M13 family peptidase [Pseudomonadota bacterium]|nr:M13 family peptidase [Pseudomonadota bacterium]